MEFDLGIRVTNFGIDGFDLAFDLGWSIIESGDISIHVFDVSCQILTKSIQLFHDTLKI